ncbi:hypothetical protein GCM10028784_28470 [Myceligenerans cantabricum]
MTDSYEVVSGGGWDADEQAFAGAPVIGAGPADGLAAPGPESPVERALTALDGLEDLPTGEHVARFEHVHDALRTHMSGDA